MAALVSSEAYLSDAIDGASTAYAELADQVATSQHQRAPLKVTEGLSGKSPKKITKNPQGGPVPVVSRVTTPISRVITPVTHL